jgi:hypothetical protein
MSAIVWDAIGERVFEAGVKNGVLYVQASDGTYPLGVAWNGLTAVTESPSGAEITDLWADGIKYASLRSTEVFGATVEAYTYPDEFAECDGSVEIAGGVRIGQQKRKAFGLCYRTEKGSDTEGLDGAGGYILHLVYGASAAPSEKAYATLAESPEGITLSWELSTIPVAVTSKKPTASVTIDSLTTNAEKLAEIELILYGTTGVDPRLPLPNELASLLLGTEVTGVTSPTFVASTGILTIPTKTGVVYKVNGEVTTAGPMAALDGGVSVDVLAVPATGYYFGTGENDTWHFTSTKA